MAGAITHLVIAEKIYDILGDNIIKNVPLFFGGNLAPDAIHAKKDYQRADKIRTHLRPLGYGYGYPEKNKVFKDNVIKFINNYYLAASESKDLYLGYVIHLIADELYHFEYCKVLEQQLGITESKIDVKEFRENLANKISNNEYNTFFADMVKFYDILLNEYQFHNNIIEILEAVWDYEIKDYINAAEINASKQYVIKKFYKNDTTQDNKNNDRDRVIKFSDFVVGNIIEQLHGIL